MQKFREWAKPYCDEAGLQKEAEDVIAAGRSSAPRLTRRHLIVASLAAMIGAGIEDNVRHALDYSHGANTVIALFIAAVASGAAALCFAELASTLPVSGSTYTYAYTAFGQAFAWIVGWLLLIQYSVGAAVIALSWSAFVTGRLDGSYVCASVLIIGCTAMLAFVSGNWAKWEKWGWPLLAGLAAVSVAAKVAQLLVTTGTNVVDGRYMTVGLSVDWRVSLAFSVLYFSFIGFDVPSTAAEDSHYPQRDLAPSILWSLLVVSVLYLAFAISGGPPETLTWWPTRLGAVVGLPSGVAVFLYGQGRILRAVARDGLFGRKGESNRDWLNLLAGPVSIALSALLISIGVYLHLFPFDDHAAASSLLTKFVSIATGVGFAVVAAGTVVLRFRRPDLPRTFTAPFLPVAVLISVAASGALIYGARDILYYFVWWPVLGAVVYVAFLVPRVIRNEKLKKARQSKV